MIVLNVDVHGLNRAMKNIHKYRQETQDRVRDAVNEAALNVQAGARRRAPVDTGNLRSRIVIEPQSQRPYVVRVGTNVKYAEMIEFGTGIHGPKGQPFEIRPKNKKALYWPGLPHPIKRVKAHPGQKAQPFLFPAWEEERPHFYEALQEAFNL